MDGNQTPEAMTKDLEAMHRSGLRKALFLEVNIGVAKGPTEFMSAEWKRNFAHAAKEADRLGMELILGTGPGWAGAGGPWVEPPMSMQHLRSSTLDVVGPGRHEGKLPVPPPRKPTAFAGLSPGLAKVRDAWYQDVCVLAFPTPEIKASITGLDLKALEETQPYSSWKHVPRFVPTGKIREADQPGAAIARPEIVDLSAKLRPDGSLDWEIPPGRWTVMRFVARNNSVTTRPAPEKGHGFETDRFNAAAFAFHFDRFHRPLLEMIGPRNPGRGLTALHLDSWESSSQNWSGNFRAEFQRRRAYDPLPFYPAYGGRIVGSPDQTERFLWDLRTTAAELVLENHAGAIRDMAHRNGLYFSSEFYDMNPAGDLDLGAVADIPKCEFWTDRIDTVYSCIEAVSIANTTGRKTVRAEAFTSPPKRGFRDSPPDMKNQTDWALAMGINDFIFHTWQHQPLGEDGPKPGMAMGPYGLHWHRNQTFWPMVGAYHEYLARCGNLLQQGTPVQDILYLTPEGAPHIFLPPEDALEGSGLLKDKHGHGFDAVSPRILQNHAVVRNGRIEFPGGSTYRVLVLPLVRSMTPQLLECISRLVHEGATVIGEPPESSPSLTGYPECDATVAKMAEKLWSGESTGRGRILRGGELTRAASADGLYPSFASTSAWLEKQGTPPVFHSGGPLRHHARIGKGMDVFFISNRENRMVETAASFRTRGFHPEIWNPVNLNRHRVEETRRGADTVEIPLRLAPFESCIVIFRKDESPANHLPAIERPFAPIPGIRIGEAGWKVTFDPALGGPEEPATMATLVPWNEHGLAGIRYYSGEAVYRTSFDVTSEIAGTAGLGIDLGMVHKMARVKLNGTDLGITWTMPHRLPTGEALKAGRNELEITVVNTWVNRLVGDQQAADKGVRVLRWENGLLGGKDYPAGRYTFSTTADVTADSPLQTSGLLGPVTMGIGFTSPSSQP